MALADPRPDTLLVAAALSQVVDEYELQVGVQEAQAAKSVYGMRLVVDLYSQSMLRGKEALDFLTALDSTTEYPTHLGPAWEQLRDGLISDLVDVLFKASRLGAKNIVLEIDRTLYLPPLPPSRPGLIARLIRALIGEDAS